jgi:hypothetical protein
MTVDLFDIAIKFADREDTVGAIFLKGKSKRNAGEPSGEKRDRQEHPDRHRRNYRPTRIEEGEVAAVDRPPRLPTKNNNNHFQKLMDSLCQNHGFPVFHKLRECKLLKRFISKPSTKKAKQEELVKPLEQEAPTEEFPRPWGAS